MKLIRIAIACSFLVLCGTAMTCKTNQVQGTIRTESALITTVDTGMNLWKDYVTAHVSDGKVTQKQVDTVKTAYQAYFDAQQVAKAAIEMSLSTGSTNTVDVVTANAAVSNAEATILNILNQYILNK